MTKRGYAAIGLNMPKDRLNIGSVMRAAAIYEVAFVAASGNRYLGYSAPPTDTTAAYRHYPLLQVNDVLSVIPYECAPVAVDLVPDAIPLPEYDHPKAAYYIFGAEDKTLDERILSKCRDHVAIPGASCSNLAMAVNVLLYDRLAKGWSRAD